MSYKTPQSKALMDVTNEERKDGNKARNPHDGCFVMVRPSKVAKGVGCFAIVDIPKGTKIFGERKVSDNATSVPIDYEKVLPKDIRQLYENFGVPDKGGRSLIVPKDFNYLSIEWFLNHSDDPNLESKNGDDLYSSRDIKKGEELFIDYGENDPGVDSAGN